MTVTADLQHFNDSVLVEDPLGRDDGDDAVVYTTRRALSRVAFVAAETAARFEREGVEHDPMAWMLTPLAMFDGETALDACLERDAFMRALILHGLGLGFDGDPSALDDLIEDDDPAVSDPDYEDSLIHGSAWHGGDGIGLAAGAEDGRPAFEIRERIGRLCGERVDVPKPTDGRVFGSGVGRRPAERPWAKPSAFPQLSDQARIRPERVA